MLLNNPMFSGIDFADCRMCISGAAPFSAESIRAMEAVVGAGKVVEVYGMTEASPLICMNPVQGKKKVGSVGVPIQGTRVRIVDIETGTMELPNGEEGELIVCGPQLMKGYHNKPEESAHALRTLWGETWLYTGDIARMDEDGYVFLVDRAKDMIIVGGYKVFSREVEEVVYGHSAVQFCAIIGVPNTARPGSEFVKLWVQPSAASAGADRRKLEAELVAWCRERLAPYKVPKFVEFVDQIPLTAVGKVDKKALRKPS
jgi:acyl-CoA synthetase (AMP-forming)/AMP-acid ligase II